MNLLANTFKYIRSIVGIISQLRMKLWKFPTNLLGFKVEIKADLCYREGEYCPRPCWFEDVSRAPISAWMCNYNPSPWYCCKLLHKKAQRWVIWGSSIYVWQSCRYPCCRFYSHSSSIEYTAIGRTPFAFWSLFHAIVYPLNVQRCGTVTTNILDEIFPRPSQNIKPFTNSWSPIHCHRANLHHCQNKINIIIQHKNKLSKIARTFPSSSKLYLPIGKLAYQHDDCTIAHIFKILSQDTITQNSNRWAMGSHNSLVL